MNEAAAIDAAAIVLGFAAAAFAAMDWLDRRLTARWNKRLGK